MSFGLGLRQNTQQLLKCPWAYFCTTYLCKTSSTLFITKSKCPSTQNTVVMVWIKKCPLQAQVNTWLPAGWRWWGGLVCAALPEEVCLWEQTWKWYSLPCFQLVLPALWLWWKMWVLSFLPWPPCCLLPYLLSWRTRILLNLWVPINPAFDRVPGSRVWSLQENRD